MGTTLDIIIIRSAWFKLAKPHIHVWGNCCCRLKYEYCTYYQWASSICVHFEWEKV